jgi:exodeoxyribonuclease VII small subunit
VKAKSVKENRDTRESKFEDSLQRLEELVQEMESGDLPLEEILKKYEEGNRLVKLCAAKLNEAEKRIEQLMKEKDGSLALEPLDDEEPAEEEKEEPKGRKAGDAEKELF